LNGILDLKGGFTISGIGQFSSGRPITLSAGRDLNSDGVNNDVYSNKVTGDTLYDPKKYGDARYANFMAAQIRGDPYYQTDLRVQKAFKFGERFKVAVLADMFNVFNRVNFGDAFIGSSRNLQVSVPANDKCGSNPVPCTYPTAQQLPRVPVSLFGGG